MNLWKGERFLEATNRPPEAIYLIEPGRKGVKGKIMTISLKRTNMNVWGIIYFTIATLCIFYRIQYGFDWSDETYYTALASRFVNGEQAFQASWDIHQFVAALVTPFLWLYKTVTGGYTGSLLFMRVLYAIIKLSAGGGLYYALRKINDRRQILPIVGTTVLFTIDPIFSLSYNSLMVVNFTIAIAFIVLSAVNKKKPVYIFLSGVFSGFGVQSYPSTIMAIPVMLLYIVLSSNRNTKAKNTIAYISGGLVVILLFLGFLLINNSFEALLNNYKFFFRDPQHTHREIDVPGYFLSIFSLKQLSVFILSYVIIFILGKTGKGTLQEVFFVGFISWVIFKAGQWIVLSFHQIEYRHFAWVSMLFPAIAIRFSEGNKSSVHLSWMLFGVAWFLSFSVSIATNNSSSFYTYPLVFSVVSIIIMLMPRSDHANSKTHFNLSKCLVIFVLVPYSVCCYMYSYNFVYRDEQLVKLTCKFSQGPAKGLYSTKEAVDKYDTIVNDICNNLPDKGRILIVKNCPYGYLLTHAMPATPRLWTTDLNYDGFEEYYNNNPNALPDAILVVDSKYGMSNGEINIGEFFNEYFNKHLYDTIVLESGTVFRFK